MMINGSPNAQDLERLNIKVQFQKLQNMINDVTSTIDHTQTQTA